MRLCTACHKLTAGEPLYCNFCGRTYDVKLCPARHINPRSALVCSQCGSPDLSTPAPPVPWIVSLLLSVLPFFVGCLLLLVSVLVLLGLLQALLRNQQFQGQAFLAVLIVAALWFLYMQLPRSLRGLFSSKRSKRNGHG